MFTRIKAALRAAFFERHVNRWAVRAYAALKPPPHRCPNMEFELDVWNGVSSLHTTAGRQLGENNTAPALYKEVVDTEHKVCRFAGSRQGRQMNVTALRLIVPMWDDVMQLTAMLRERFVQFHGGIRGAMNPRQSYVFSKIGAAYLAFLARRRERPVADGSISPLLTAFFTLAVGPFMVVRALMEMGDTTPLDLSLFSADVWYDLAERSGSLLAGLDRACAASRKMIVDYLDVAINGAYARPLVSTEATRALADIDDWNAFYRYLYASSRLELLVKLNQALVAQVLFGLQTLPIDAIGGELRASIDAALARCFVRTASPLDPQTLLANYIAVTHALLDELRSSDVVPALAAVALVDRSGDRVLPAAGDLAGAARQIRSATLALHPHCVAEMAELHAALGWQDVAPIAVEQQFSRVAGPGLMPLVDALEARAHDVTMLPTADSADTATPARAV